MDLEQLWKLGGATAGIGAVLYLFLKEWVVTGASHRRELERAHLAEDRERQRAERAEAENVRLHVRLEEAAKTTTKAAKVTVQAAEVVKETAEQRSPKA